MKFTASFQARLSQAVIVLALLTNQFGYAVAQEPSSPAANQNSNRQTSADPSANATPDSTSSQATPLPDSPGAVQNQSAGTTTRPAAPTQSGGQSQEQEAIQAQQPPPQQQQAPAQAQPVPHEPVGTAAAQTVPTTGIAASRPAGAALAPAKQRRVRSILIKVGALVGAAAAIGTTVALSESSPSKPPGAR